MTHIEQRGSTAAQWAAANPVLYKYELGWESDTRKSKLGDGVTPWNSLAYTVSDVAVTKASIGLGAVDNTSDADKPLSNAAISALALKANALNTAPKDSPVFTGNPTAPTPAIDDDDFSIATTGFVKDQAYAPLASPALTGNPTAPTPAPGDNDTSIATSAFVTAALLAKLGVTTSTSLAVPASSAWSISSQQWTRWGRFVMVTMTVVREGADLAGTATGDVTNTSFATVADSSWFPASTVGTDSGSNGPNWAGVFSTAGVFQYTSAPPNIGWSQTGARSFSCVYLTAA